MAYSIVFTPEAEEQLLNLYRYLADRASPEIAIDYTNSVLEHCEELTIFPCRGTKRDDIRSGLRITHHKKRTIIAFAVFDTTVSILGIYHGGQSYDVKLTEKDGEGSDFSIP